MADAPDRSWVGSMPEAYERWLGPAVFRPFAADLARRVADHRPQRILEIAAGTGMVTRELLAAVHGAEIIATDLSDAMVQFGRSIAPGAQWQQADALELPFDDGRFDAVVCQFGVMFFPDKVKAYAEARRVLRPGGSLLFNTWGTVEEHDFAAALGEGLEHAGLESQANFIAAVPHGYCDADTVIGDVRAAGFTSISVETITLEGSAPARDIATGFCTGTPLRQAIEARTDLAATTDAVAGVMESRLGRGEVTGRMTAHVFDASGEP